MCLSGVFTFNETILLELLPGLIIEGLDFWGMRSPRTASTGPILELNSGSSEESTMCLFSLYSSLSIVSGFLSAAATKKSRFVVASL